MSLVLDLALRFGGNGFYTYRILFASQAAGRLHQFNQGTYWGTLDRELYCRIFPARALLNLCGTPSHPTTTCTLTASLPPTSFHTSHKPAVFHNMPTAPSPSITPTPVNIQLIALCPLPKGVDKIGRPILYQGGSMVYSNFNDLGCKVSSCRFLHTCSFMFVIYLIQGFKNGFHPGLLVTPDFSYSCHNLQSATFQPNIVDKLLDQEI